MLICKEDEKYGDTTLRKEDLVEDIGPESGLFGDEDARNLHPVGKY